MSWLTIAVQVLLIAVVVYVLVRVIQDELAHRRWWKAQLDAMKGKSAWKP